MALLICYAAKHLRTCLCKHCFRLLEFPLCGTRHIDHNKDTLNLHVGAAGGSELARSFVHLGLDALPPGASVSGATITVVSNADQTQNVNPSAAIVQACVLTRELPAQFDSANPPPYDCSKGSAVGKAAVRPR